MNRTYAVVTTCSAKGWETYGRRMARTFVEFWPKEIGLTVYAEGFTGDVEGVRYLSLPPWLANFKQRHGGSPRVNGGERHIYNFKMDAVRFAHKVAAVTAETFNTDADVLIWMDADTVTHAPVPFEFIAGLMSDNHGIAWLDRPNMYPECGFYLLNVKHIEVQAIVNAWELLYRYDKLFAYQEWHDSYILQQLVAEHHLPWVSLSGPVATSHPMVNGPLGAYMDHLKGARKGVGRSLDKDLKVKRTEPYWVKK